MRAAECMTKAERFIEVKAFFSWENAYIKVKTTADKAISSIITQMTLQPILA